MKRMILCLLLFNAGSSKVFGQYWEPLGGGVGEGVQVTDLAVDTFHNILYVGGAFTQIGNIEATDLAIWDGFTYRSITQYPVGITDLTMKGDTLICLSGALNGSKVGMYVDSQFIDLLPSLPGGAHCIEYIHDTLFAGGEFLYGLMFLDGYQWKVYHNGVGGPLARVNAIGEYNGDLIVAGHFDQVGGNLDVNNIAGCDGTEWYALGEGITDPNGFPTIEDIEQFEGELYAGGTFENAGGIFTGSIAKWNGNSWSIAQLSNNGSGCGGIEDFYYDQEYLYTIGTTTSANECMGDRAAMFDGVSWSNLHLSESGVGYCIAVFQGDIIAGTNFNKSQTSDTINYIGKFLGYPSAIEVLPQITTIALYPNPANESLQFLVSTEKPFESEKGTLIMRDSYGKVIWSRPIILEEGKSYTLALPAGMSDGMYQLCVETPDEVIIGSFIKQH